MLVRFTLETKPRRMEEGRVAKEGVPKIKLEATHQRALDVVSLDDLKGFALEDGAADRGTQDPARGGPIR